MKSNLKVFGGRILSILFAIFLAACGGSTGSGDGGGGVENATITGTVAGTVIVAVDENDNEVDRVTATGSPKSFTLNVTVGGNYRVYFIENEGTADERVFSLYQGTTNVFTVSSAVTIDLGFVDTSTGVAVPTNNPLDVSGVTSGGENTTIPPNIGTTFKMAEYFPLGQGDTWTYDNNNETHLISGTETVNGVDVPKMITDVVDGDTYLLFDIDSGALRIHKIADLDDIEGCGWSQTVFTPPLIIIPVELSIGEKHTTSTTENYTNCTGASATQTVTLEGTLEAVEDVTVTAGTFKASLKYRIIISSILDDQGEPQNSDQTWWLAKGIGLVKSIENGRTEELISATVGGISYP